MTRTIATKEPTRARAGLTWEWDKTISLYPPSEGWTLTYTLTGAGAEAITITATTSAAGDYYEVRVAKGTTADYTAGRYDLIGTVDDGTDAFPVYKGALFVDPATNATPELSFAERMLALTETKISDRLSADISSYSIEQQQVHREELARLHALRNAYAEAVRIERGGPDASGLRPAGAVRFGSPV